MLSSPLSPVSPTRSPNFSAFIGVEHSSCRWVFSDAIIVVLSSVITSAVSVNMTDESGSKKTQNREFLIEVSLLVACTDLLLILGPATKDGLLNKWRLHLRIPHHPCFFSVIFLSLLRWVAEMNFDICFFKFQKPVIKEKKNARESFVCGACGQLGHMRTNKNCPKYGEDFEARVESFRVFCGE